MRRNMQGYRVIMVSSGDEAIFCLENESVDLVVLDMIMDPGMDGLNTFREIIKLHPAQKAIIASGFSETDRVKKAITLGAGPYIKKPYTWIKLSRLSKQPSIPEPHPRLLLCPLCGLGEGVVGGKTLFVVFSS